MISDLSGACPLRITLSNSSLRVVLFPPTCFLHFGALRFSAHLIDCHFTCACRAKCCAHWLPCQVFGYNKDRCVRNLYTRSVLGLFFDFFCVGRRVPAFGHADRMRRVVRHTRFPTPAQVRTTSLSLGNSLSLGDVHISKTPAHCLRTESEQQRCAPLSAPRHSLTTSPPQRECGVHVANSCT